MKLLVLVWGQTLEDWGQTLKLTLGFREWAARRRVEALWKHRSWIALPTRFYLREAVKSFLHDSASSPPPTANARSEIAPCATICDVLCSITIVGPPTLNHIAVGPSYLPVRRSLASSYATVPKQNDASNSQRPMTVNTMPAAVRMIRLFMRRSF